MAAHSPPDGYTVFLVNPANAINATLYKNLPFDFLRDMAPVAGFIRVPNVMEVNPSVPAHTVKEFIDYAKANPGKVDHGVRRHRHVHPFVRRAVHADDRRQSGACALSRRGAGAHRPAGRPGAGVVRQSAVFDRLYRSRPAARARGDDGERARKALPDVPTVAETVPGYEASAWFGMAVPAATPRDIVDKLNRAVNDALADPAMQAKLAELGGTLIPGTPEDFGNLIADETDKWAKVVKATGATAE